MLASLILQSPLTTATTPVFRNAYRAELSEFIDGSPTSACRSLEPGADPGEARNLAAQHPDLATRLQQNLQSWQAEMKPQIIPDDHSLYVHYSTMKK